MVISHSLRGLLLAVACLPAIAQEPIAVLERREVEMPRAAPAPVGQLRLTLAVLEDTGWEEARVLGAVREAGTILAQCGIALHSAELVRIHAPAQFHDFLTPVSRRLADAVKLGRPTVWFVRDTRQRPAFDAEAIGRGNSRSRPEIADTVWITRGTRDLAVVLAHELAHVLMDSGEHATEPGNLMNDETAAGNTRLSPAQCARLSATATANGLLRPARPGTDPIRLPLAAPAGWQVMEFRGIPPHRIRFSATGLEMSVDRSAMPLIYPLPKPLRAGIVRVRGRVEGTLAIPADRQGEEGFDDYVFRIGLVESGTRTLNFMQRQVAAPWVRKLFELAPAGGGISRIQFLNVGMDAKQVGKARQHPLSELLHERVVAAPRPDGRFDFEYKLDRPLETLAIWLSADGDDSGSTFTVRIEEIELRPASP